MEISLHLEWNLPVQAEDCFESVLSKTIENAPKAKSSLKLAGADSF